MLPHLQGRPVTMERYPSGIGRQGFWQKDVSRGFPEWLERVEVPKKDGVVHHPLATDTRSLLWMANQNAITLHVWPSRVPPLLHPDLCLFDLDPATDDPGAARAATLEVARPADRARASELGEDHRLEGIPRCGPAGRHGRLRRGRRLRPSRRRPAREAQPRAADAGVPEGRPRRAGPGRHRPQRLERDLRRGLHRAGKTGRAGVGARAHGPRWSAAKSSPRSFTLRSMAERLAAVGDLWSDLLDERPVAPRGRWSGCGACRIDDHRDRCHRSAVLPLPVPPWRQPSRPQHAPERPRRKRETGTSCPRPHVHCSLYRRRPAITPPSWPP